MGIFRGDQVDFEEIVISCLDFLLLKPGDSSASTAKYEGVRHWRSIVLSLYVVLFNIKSILI